jgi:hypothetical protein
MSNKSAPFLNRLREMRERDSQEQVNKAEALRRWQEQLGTMLRQLESWLAQPIQEGLVTLEWTQVSVSDVKYGDYQTHGMKLTFPGRTVVSLRPLGKSSMGSRGLVEMACEWDKTLIVMDRRGIWRIRDFPTSGERLEVLELTQDSFTRVLQGALP